MCILWEMVKKYVVECESVCEDMVRVLLMMECVLEWLESSANAEVASASRRVDALGMLVDVLECVCVFFKGGEVVVKVCDGLFVDVV